jgi:imidazolonepropionase-like amidohydrolase
MVKRKFNPAFKSIFFLILACGFLMAPVRADDVIALKVGTLLKGNGEVLKDAIIIIKNGKIEFAGVNYPVPKGTNILEFKEGVATPGFIAANACLHISQETKEVSTYSREDFYEYRIEKIPALNEERSETTPEMNLLYSVDPRSEDFALAWRSGVTCVYLAPGNLNVYNGTGTVLKTWGQSPQNMTVRNMVQIKVTLGEEPAVGAEGSRFDPGLRTRRPQNRMGVDSIFRQALVDLQNKSELPDSQLNPQELLFRKVLQGEISLRIRAKSYVDIKSAFRYMEEFGFKWILEEGVDAYKYLDDLKNKNVPVIYGPVYRPKGRFDFNSENDFYRAQTPILLAKKGILFAFQNDAKSPISALRDEAIYAVKLGLDEESALKALTFHAAKILGVEDRIGTVEKGKDGDLLIFSGDPFSPSSRLEKVLINGKVMDPNK